MNPIAEALRIIALHAVAAGRPIKIKIHGSTKLYISAYGQRRHFNLKNLDDSPDAWLESARKAYEAAKEQ